MADEKLVAIVRKGADEWNHSLMKLNRDAKVGRSGAEFSRANLSGADLTRAYLSGADLSGAKLGRADLTDANLSRADLRAADLRRANLHEALLFGTVLTDVDLSAVTGLETCRHLAPSIIDHRTLQRSGRLPLAFLRGVGLPDSFIRPLHNPFLTPV